jgi:fatty acid desaturase
MDEQEIQEQRQRRETFLTIFLTLAAGAGILFFLILITGGFFLYVLLGLAAIVALGFFHYLLWGQRFTDQVAEEREEAEARERAEAEEKDWPMPEERFRPPRF